jgi:dGTPase
MKWEKLLSAKRLGQENKDLGLNYDIRTEFQRDYDRIIFSSAFRRLQNKTQVFPLPGNIYVHNRLTHSLEVSSVGRSLGNLLSNWLIKNGHNHDHIREIGSIVASASLAHDLGNPPFGHSGEKAISYFFIDGMGRNLKNLYSTKQWNDLLTFEGNANTLRLLTNQFGGKREGGFALTYSCLASIIKYPWSSSHPNGIKKKKYGFFDSEQKTFHKILDHLEIPQLGEDEYARHPLVFLVEAADDICYQIMDIEDAHKLNILSTKDTIDIMMSYFDSQTSIDKIHKTCTQVHDINEQIAYIRANIMGKLISECIEVFCENYKEIMAGKFKSSLISKIPNSSANAYKNCTNLAFSKIYTHDSVLEIELSGCKILGTLLEEFTNALFCKDSYYSDKLLSLIPKQFNINTDDAYTKTMSILDYISGMTDVYALNLYRKITGIELKGIR